MTVEFQAWPKTSRLYRDVVITEKIDGTNACVIVTDEGQVFAQSRKRLITPDDDNFGFARWVHENSGPLVELLGEGRHFGEWWGLGIQRGYGLDHKRFSLFNTAKWDAERTCLGMALPGLDVVPVLYQGVFTHSVVRETAEMLSEYGSKAAQGFDNPEGVCIFHTQSRQVYKYTPRDGDGHKGVAA